MKSTAKKAANTKLKKAQKKAMTSVDIFASAEEFSALIDENEQDEDVGGMEQVNTFLALKLKIFILQCTRSPLIWLNSFLQTNSIWT